MYHCNYYRINISGTWRTHVVDSASKFISVTQDISVNFAATLQVNPPTAYRMLKDFIHLQPGNTRMTSV